MSIVTPVTGFTRSTAIALLASISNLTPAPAQPADIGAFQTLEAPMDVDAPEIDDLMTTARAQGLVRVIARVARPAGVPTDRIGAAEIAAATNEFVNRAQNLGVAGAEPIVGLPLAVIEVTAEQLRQMAAAGLVSHIVEDVPEPPTLQDSIPLVNADDAATLGVNGAGQTIAILDTGVEAAHPFFGGRVVSEACFSSNSTASGATSVCPGGVTNSTAAGSAAPCGNAGCDHGTHVAGIAAGSDTARRGVAPQADIIAIQVFSLFTDSTTPGGPQSCANNGRPSPCILTFQSDQIRGLQRVFDLRNNFTIAAVNMSLGGGDFATCDNDPRKALVDQLRAADIATVMSSGNGGSSTGVGAPGCITTAITVGNTTKTDTVATTSDSAAVVDLLAPGTNITSSILNGNFGAKTGTSMAAPHVAGAVAALRSLRNNLTVDQIEQVLKCTGISITDTRNNLTRPRINLEAAVRALPTTTPVCGEVVAPVVQYILEDDEPLGVRAIAPIIDYAIKAAE
ncbi:S8 family peptidase [Mesorhizobium temperatum]|nr:S8 family serine peptidase [Mesorhizobium temperatum]